MKLIRTKVRNVIGDADITRIAKEMCNIYTGCKYFLDDGRVDLAAKETYLEWEQNGMTYSYRPVRGFIHINFKGGIYDTAFKSTIVRGKLLAEFQRINQWGWRRDIYTDHATGTGQFTLEKFDAALYLGGSDMTIAVGQPFHTKNREFKFCWIITDQASLFQYSAPGKFPKAYNMTASFATIAIDVAHTVTDLEDNFRVMGFPPLLKNIDVVPTKIHLSQILGIDGHIYHQMGGPSPDSKCWGTHGFSKITLRLETSELVKRGAKVHLVKTVDELEDAETADDDGSRCTVCRVELFDRYYQIQHSGNTAVVCRFCAHYNPRVHAEIMNGQYKIAIATSTTTRESVIEAAPMQEAEREIVRRLHQEIEKGTLEFTMQNENSGLAIVNMSGGALIITAETGDQPGPNAHRTLIGIRSSKAYQDVLEHIHKFPDYTRVFEFSQAW